MKNEECRMVFNYAASSNRGGAFFVPAMMVRYLLSMKL